MTKTVQRIIADLRKLAANSLALASESAAGENWKTINGAHVLIKDGVISEGPAHLKGKTESGKVRPNADRKSASGWKLHLATDKHEQVSNYLKSKGLAHKVGHSGDQEGKDITVYAGHRDVADKAARDISNDVGHLLKHPHGETTKDDAPMAPKVHGRFDIGAVDSNFHQYGSAGVPFLNEDVGNRAFGGKMTAADAKARAHAALSKKYGSFYSGSDKSPDWIKHNRAVGALSLASEDGEWRTIHGVHVLIRSGKIASGEHGLEGKTVEEAHEHLNKTETPAHVQYTESLKAQVREKGSGRFTSHRKMAHDATASHAEKVQFHKGEIEAAKAATGISEEDRQASILHHTQQMNHHQREGEAQVAKEMYARQTNHHLVEGQQRKADRLQAMEFVNKKSLSKPDSEPEKMTPADEAELMDFSMMGTSEPKKADDAEVLKPESTGLGNVPANGVFSTGLDLTGQVHPDHLEAAKKHVVKLRDEADRHERHSKQTTAYGQKKLRDRAFKLRAQADNVEKQISAHEADKARTPGVRKALEEARTSALQPSPVSSPTEPSSAAAVQKQKRIEDLEKKIKEHRRLSDMAGLMKSTRNGHAAKARELEKRLDELNGKSGTAKSELSDPNNPSHVAKFLTSEKLQHDYQRRYK